MGDRGVRRRRVTPLAGIALAAVLVFQSLPLVDALRQGRALAADSRAFERALPNAERRLLVIGDSTAVGTGARDPADSVAGRLAACVPALEIVNLAEDGARTGELIEQLGRARGSFDVLLIQTGGNDILWFSDLERLRGEAAALLRAARDRSDRIVMMSTGDVGSAPAFPFPIDRLYSWRTIQVHGVLRDTAARHRVEYVDLYDPGPDNPFRRNPERFYAADGLHPSAAGYRLWFEQLRAQSSITRALGGDPDCGGA